MFLHLDGVSAESTDACVGFLEDMVARGLGSPVLTATDGAPGLCAAIDQVFPSTRTQKCWVHYADLGIMPTWCPELALEAV